MKKILLLTTTLFVSSLAFADAPAPAMRKSSGMMGKLSDYYAKIEAGISMADKTKITASATGTITGGGTAKPKYNTNFVGGIGGGYRFNEFFRTDLMLQYTSSKSKNKTLTINNNNWSSKIKVNTYNAMLNGYLDAHNDTIFTPYVLAGIGIGHNKATITVGPFSGKPKKTNFIWNIGAGVMAKMHDQINVGLEYRYVDFGKLAKKSATVAGTTVSLNTKKFKAHQLLLNLIYDL